MRLKHLLSVFLTLLTLSVGQMWGDSVTFDATKDSGSGSITKSPITASTSTMNRSQKDNFRCNSGATLVISSTTATITNISITCTGSGTSNYGPGKFSVSQNGTYSYSDNVGTWSGSSQSITFSASAQVRMTSIVVTYSSGCTGTKLGTPNVTAEASSGQIRLTWPAVNNASSYQLKWNGGEWASATSPVVKTGLSNGTAYSYQVKAIGNGSDYCDGDASTEASATPNHYHNVTWNTHNEEFATTQVLDDTKPTFPKVNDEDPTSCDDDADKFYGWSTTAFNKTDDISEKTIYTSASDMPKVTTDNVVYYAVFTDAEAADYSTTYTSNVTLPSSGTNASSTTVQIGSNNNIPATKLGKNGAGGSGTFTVPVGTTKLYVHAVGWNGKSSTLTLSTSVGSISPSNAQALTANSGATGSTTPFNLGTPTTDFFEYTLSEITSTATITITAGTERAIIYGVNYASGSSSAEGNYLTNCCTSLGQINGSVLRTHF